MEEGYWWRLTFDIAASNAADADELACDLVAHGAAGCETQAENRVSGYFRAESADLDAVLAEVCSARIACIERAVVKDENWTGRCLEVWQPVRAGALTITPVLETGTAPTRDSGGLSLIPGLGFGTGHHATTRMVLLLLQHPLLQQAALQRTLDLGTGSGILALAFVRLYGGAATAVDTDPDALRNAADNVALNGAERSITLQLGGIEAAAGRYQLVMANLYTEILLQLERPLSRTVDDHGWLLMSGFTASQAALVRDAYQAPEWEQIAELTEEGWGALLLRRR